MLNERIEAAGFSAMEKFNQPTDDPAIPEWGGKKLRIPLEDDAMVTAPGVEWRYPIKERVLLIR